jgi:SNF2 family DNA or RNA helicase
MRVDEALSAFGWARPLRAHQREAIAHALTAVNAANFSVPGSGKTAAALATAVTHLYAGTIDLVVVVGPLACFDPWEQETYRLVGERIPVHRVRGSARQRMLVYDRAHTGQLLLVSYATAAADQSVLLELFDRLRIMLVVDESHRIKRFRGGLWASSLAELARRARVRLVLSGTPMPQSGRDLYSQLTVLWPDGQLTGTRDAFAAQVENSFPNVIQNVRPFMSRTPKAALGLAPYVVEKHEVPLLNIQAEVYELIANNFIRSLADAETWRDKLETLRRARPIRLMQAATNPNLLNLNDGYYRVRRIANDSPTLMERLSSYRELEVPAKSLAAVDLVRQIAASNGKVVCWSNFIANLDEFSQLIRDRIGIPTFQVDGRVPAGVDALHDDIGNLEDRPGETDTREAVIHRFLNESGPAILVTNPASCSESISLHSSCHNAIYLDRTYDAALFLQSIDRIHRLGLPQDVTVTIHILTATLDGAPTIDGLVDSSLARKEARMLDLLQGAEIVPMSLANDAAEDAEGDETDLAILLRYLLGEAE